jgi:predicted alpha/beta superfamily hydrolase
LKLVIYSLTLLLILTSELSIAFATTPFQIPRSKVVEIKDPDSQRVYPLFIKLPKSYAKNDDKAYPVIYLTDAWYTFQIVSGATRYPMNAQKMKEAIIVGISYAKGSKRDASRVRDYTPTINKSWQQTTGGAQQHMAFIEASVINYIDKNYRTDRQDRTFVGNSLGGLFGTYILLTKPTLFNHYILGSPSYWFDNKVIFTLEEAHRKRQLTINANIFIAIGERESKALDSSHDMVKDAENFYEKILNWQQTHVKAKIVIIPEANHQTAFPTTVIQGLHWIYKI